MKIKKILADNLFAAFFALCAVMLTESALLRLAGFTAPLAVGLTALFFMAATVFFYLNRKNTAVYLGTAALLFLIICVLSAAGVSAVSVVTFMVNATTHLFYGGTPVKGELVFITAAMSLLLSALLFPLSRLREARYATAAAAAALLVYYGISGLSADFAESFAAAGIIMAVPTELCLSFLYRNERRKKLNGILSFLLPLFMLVSFSAAILPSPEKPIDWSFVTNIASGIANTFESIIENIDIMFNPEPPEFSINMQGYSDAESVFGGDIKENEQSRLLVSFRSPPHSSVYLIGNVNDTYTGKGWKQSNVKRFSENDSYLDYCETIIALERAGYTEKDLWDFTARTSLTVKYDNIITKSLFYPLKTIGISEAAGYDASLPSVTFDKRPKKNDTYKLTYFEIDYRSEHFKALFNQSFSYDEPSENTGRSIDGRIPHNVVEILNKRADYIEKTYTEVPDSVSQRTHSLADRITADCKNNYEKLCAIESYLKGYSYTLTPGEVPDGQDPVDYFLFESGMGYCTYFASAMVLLARCESIPVRYVQGFAVDSSEIELLEDHPVASSCAHAWAEAYIEGVGWVPFEPTASMNDSRYGYNGRQSSDIPEFNRSDYQYPQKPDLPEIPPDKTGNKTDVTLYMVISAVVISGIILIVLICIFVKLRIFIGMYRSGNDTDKFMHSYKMILYLCEKSKYKLESGETIDRFAERLSVLLPDEKISFTQITCVFDRIRYGGGEALSEERKLSEEYLRNMFNRIKEKKGKFAALKAFVGYCFSQ